MRTRIESILERPMGGMLGGHVSRDRRAPVAAHATGVMRICRKASRFSTVDDQLRCIRRVLRDSRPRRAALAPRQVQGFINARKDEGAPCRAIEDQGDVWAARMLRIYAAYQETCERTGVVEFRRVAAAMPRGCSATVTTCSRTIGSASATSLVDEFQDTQHHSIRVVEVARGGAPATCAASVTTISRSTAGGAPASRTSFSFQGFRTRQDGAPRGRTTDRAATSSPRQTP